MQRVGWDGSGGTHHARVERATCHLQHTVPADPLEVAQRLHVEAAVLMPVEADRVAVDMVIIPGTRAVVEGPPTEQLAHTRG